MIGRVAPGNVGELFATLYRNLGIDTEKALLPDLTGCPQCGVDFKRQG